MCVCMCIKYLYVFIYSTDIVQFFSSRPNTIIAMKYGLLYEGKLFQLPKSILLYIISSTQCVMNSSLLAHNRIYSLGNSSMLVK